MPAAAVAPVRLIVINDDGTHRAVNDDLGFAKNNGHWRPGKPE